MPAAHGQLARVLVPSAGQERLRMLFLCLFAVTCTQARIPAGLSAEPWLWRVGATPAASKVLEMAIALRQGRHERSSNTTDADNPLFVQLEAHARARSDPSSSLHGSYLERSAIDTLVRPSNATLAAIGRRFGETGDLRLRFARGADCAEGGIRVANGAESVCRCEREVQLIARANEHAVLLRRRRARTRLAKTKVMNEVNDTKEVNAQFGGNCDFLLLRGLPVRVAELIFDARFITLEHEVHAGTGAGIPGSAATRRIAQFIRAERPFRLPKELKPYVDFVSHMTHLPLASTLRNVKSPSRTPAPGPPHSAQAERRLHASYVVYPIAKSLDILCHRVGCDTDEERHNGADACPAAARKRLVAALRTLALITRVQLQHPNDVRYRQLDRSNAHFWRTVGALDGGHEVMYSLGWRVHASAEGVIDPHVLVCDIQHSSSRSKLATYGSYNSCSLATAAAGLRAIESVLAKMNDITARANAKVRATAESRKEAQMLTRNNAEAPSIATLTSASQLPFANPPAWRSADAVHALVMLRCKPIASARNLSPDNIGGASETDLSQPQLGRIPKLRELSDGTTGCGRATQMMSSAEILLRPIDRKQFQTSARAEEPPRPKVLSRRYSIDGRLFASVSSPSKHSIAGIYGSVVDLGGQPFEKQPHIAPLCKTVRQWLDADELEKRTGDEESADISRWTKQGRRVPRGRWHSGVDVGTLAAAMASGQKELLQISLAAQKFHGNTAAGFTDDTFRSMAHNESSSTRAAQIMEEAPFCLLTLPLTKSVKRKSKEAKKAHGKEKKNENERGDTNRHNHFTEKDEGWATPWSWAGVPMLLEVGISYAFEHPAPASLGGTCTGRPVIMALPKAQAKTSDTEARNHHIQHLVRQRFGWTWQRAPTSMCKAMFTPQPTATIESLRRQAALLPILGPGGSQRWLPTAKELMSRPFEAAVGNKLSFVEFVGAGTSATAGSIDKTTLHRLEAFLDHNHIDRDRITKQLTIKTLNERVMTRVQTKAHVQASAINDSGAERDSELNAEQLEDRASTGAALSDRTLADVATAMALAPEIPIEVWSVGGSGLEQQEPFLRWLMTLGSAIAPPQVACASYNDVETLLPPAYTARINAELMKCALRGVSLVFSAGEDGSPGPGLRSSRQMQQRAAATAAAAMGERDGESSARTARDVPTLGADINARQGMGNSRRNGAFCSDHDPEALFPASSPWVTSVGATAFQISSARSADSTGNAELELVAASAGGIQGSGYGSGGGGFSRRFKVPWYQRGADVTTAYVKWLLHRARQKHQQPLQRRRLLVAVDQAIGALELPLPMGTDTGSPDGHGHKKVFDARGRGYPDVAAQASASGLAAASTSAPRIATMLALLNGERLQLGRPPLGFVNPMLYRLGGAASAARSTSLSGEQTAATRRLYDVEGSATPADAASADSTPNGQKLVESPKTVQWMSKAVDEQRLAALGRAAFSDVKTGDSRCSSDGTACCSWGFPAAPGWDAVTGWGVPSYAVLRAALVAFPCITSHCDGGGVRHGSGDGSGGSSGPKISKGAGRCDSHGRCSCAAGAFMSAKGSCQWKVRDHSESAWLMYAALAGGALAALAPAALCRLQGKVARAPAGGMDEVVPLHQQSQLQLQERVAMTRGPVHAQAPACGLVASTREQQHAGHAYAYTSYAQLQQQKREDDERLGEIARAEAQAAVDRGRRYMQRRKDIEEL